MTSERSPIRLLHVDDDQMFLDLAAIYFERADAAFDVHAVTSPEAALAALDESTYDVVVSDHDMPGQTGIELLKEVRETDPDLPFVLFTGKGSEEVASEAIASGVSDYLQKGSTDKFHLLINGVTNLVSQYHAETNLEQYADQQRIVADLGQIALERDLEALFDAVVTQVATGLDVEYTKILDYHPADEELLLLAGVGWEGAKVGKTCVGIGPDSQAGYTLQTEAPVVVTDLATDDRFRGPQLLVDHDVVSGISVIIGTTDDPWGILGVHTTSPRRFTDDDVTFVQSVANVLSAAIARTAYRKTIETQADLFEKVQELARVGAWEWDVEADDDFWTPEAARIYGLDEDDGSMTNRFERFHPEDRPTIEAAFERASVDGEPYDLEVRLIRPDGEHRWVRIRGEPQYEDGDVVRVRGTIQDITDQKERELELTEAIAQLNGSTKSDSSHG